MVQKQLQKMKDGSSSKDGMGKEFRRKRYDIRYGTDYLSGARAIGYLN